MAEPYYSDNLVTLYHGDSTPALEAMSDAEVDLVITDPPYDERTHAMARSNNTAGPAGMRSLHGSRAAFGSLSAADHRALFTRLGEITSGWIISSLSSATAFEFELDPPAGLRCLRVAAWVKTNPMPILSADRPAMGWEPIVCLHREDRKPKWNGGGRAMNYVGPTSQGSGHPTQKPLAMVQQWVQLFSSPGDRILDPFAGSGTTLLAARNEGRRAVGFEVNERYCELTAKRLSQQAFDLEGLSA